MDILRPPTYLPRLVNVVCEQPLGRKFNALRFHGKIQHQSAAYVTAPETEKLEQRRELKFVKTKRSKIRHLKTSMYIPGYG